MLSSSHKLTDFEIKSNKDFKKCPRGQNRHRGFQQNYCTTSESS